VELCAEHHRHGARGPADRLGSDQPVAGRVGGERGAGEELRRADDQQ
jgi:hypothetical protein